MPSHERIGAVLRHPTWRAVVIPCGCSKKRKYEVTTRAGDKHTVDTLTAAMALIRKEGGRYVPVKVDR